MINLALKIEQVLKTTYQVTEEQATEQIFIIKSKSYLKINGRKPLSISNTFFKTAKIAKETI